MIPASSLGWFHSLPGLIALRRYQRRWLPHEGVAELVLATMLVPVGMVEYPCPETPACAAPDRCPAVPA